MISNPPISPSAVSASIADTGAKTASDALPTEVMHNLRYQHNWTDVQLYIIIPDATAPLVECTNIPTTSLPAPGERTYLIRGTPPRHSYMHPDLLAHLVKNEVAESAVAVQREWVLAMSTGERWSLAAFCRVFDRLPAREVRDGVGGFRHQDAKRVLCALKANDGSGGDGTLVYYIMQEGEVKPRQN